MVWNRLRLFWLNIFVTLKCIVFFRMTALWRHRVVWIRSFSFLFYFFFRFFTFRGFDFNWARADVLWLEMWKVPKVDGPNWTFRLKEAGPGKYMVLSRNDGPSESGRNGPEIQNRFPNKNTCSCFWTNWLIHWYLWCSFFNDFWFSAHATVIVIRIIHSRNCQIFSI